MAGVALVGLVLARGAFNSQMVKVASLKGSIALEEKKSTALDRILTLSDALQKLKGKGWPSTDFASVVEALSRIQEVSGINIQVITPEEKRDEKDFVAIPFSLNAEATYRDLVRFLATLAASPHLLVVHEVTLTPGGEQGSLTRGVVLRVTVKGEAIFFKK